MSIRMRHTKGHTRNRRSHHGLEETRVSTDSKTGVRHLRHRASLETGKYRGRDVLNVGAATQAAAETEDKEVSKKEKEQK